MRRFFLIVSVLLLCVFALIGCRDDAAFDAGESLSAKELEALQNSLREQEKEGEESDESTLDDTPEQGGEQSGVGDELQNDDIDENKTVFYYTETGEVYHTNRDCTYLSKSKDVREGDLSQVEKAGKNRVCSLCAKAEQEGQTSENDGDHENGDKTESDTGMGENKTIVYYTVSGETYHFDRNCTYLRNSKQLNEGSVDDALAAGKARPCSRCGD